MPLLQNAEIKGFAEVMKNLDKELEKLKDKSASGLIKCTILIRNETEKTSPVTPVDLGNLRSSWFVTSAKKKEAKDSYNTGFVNSRKGSKRKVDIAKLVKDHSAAIAEGMAMAKTYMVKGILVVFGYSANYAAAVHEKIGANFKRPDAGPKWFETAVKRNTGEIVSIIANETKIK